ncbi:MAG: DedA family protein [Candidatus Dormibacteria bacterium]
MDFLTGLHGSIATLLICVLLLVDEAGVPLPFIPNEVLLIVAGLLIASGAVNPLIFYPLAVLALLGGSLTGYSWARRVGPRRLRRVAEVLRAVRAFDRARERVEGASPRHLAVARVLPGIRTYATLCAGAFGVPPTTFWRANVPAILAWVGLLTAVGYTVGVPAEHVLSAVETTVFNFALSGGLLVLLGFLAYRAARRAPDPRREPELGPFHGIRRRDRYVLAVLVDAGIVAVVLAGVDRITRGILNLRVTITAEGRYDVILIVLGIAVAYLVVSRRSATGETAGERLFDVTYVHERRPAPAPGPFDDLEEGV